MKELKHVDLKCARPHGLLMGFTSKHLRRDKSTGSVLTNYVTRFIKTPDVPAKTRRLAGFEPMRIPVFDSDTRDVSSQASTQQEEKPEHIRVSAAHYP